ncbi:MAG: hypothetical protein HC878_00070 [Leptolyngbyaceae cyanobacterium SL_5_14]|nr:hypothetical protein [Leptolyngbyaceae cyanobacterium SL_5_14]
MVRSNLSTGDIWTEDIANGVVSPQVDGANNWGSIALIRDQNMSPDPDQLLSRSYNFLNRLKLFPGAGRSVAYSSSFYLTNLGTILFIPAGEFVLPENSTGCIYLDGVGTMAFASTLPDEGLHLALFVTDASSIIDLVDLREQAIARSQVNRIPAVRSAFAPGDIKVSFNPNAQSGWLACTGQFLLPSAYPALFEAIGYLYGRSGDMFQLPDPSDRFILATSQVEELGELGGSNNTYLNINQLPRHTHALTQQSHQHIVEDSRHSHDVLDNGHVHLINDPGHEHRALNQRETNVFFDYLPESPGSEISKKGTGQFMPVARAQTGISMQAENSNITLRSAVIRSNTEFSRIQITANPTGNSAAIDNTPAYIKAQVLIKI